jgi:hypothetical protein
VSARRGGTLSPRERGHERAGAASKRLAIAVVAALAIHVDLFLFIPRHDAAPAEERVITQPITLAVRTPPPPTPRPTPPPVVPTPRITPPPHYTLAPKIVARAPAPKAVAKPRHTVGGAAAPKHVTRATPVPQPAMPASVAEGTHEGVASGGAGTGAGPGSGDGGLGGTGTGTGGVGTGNGGETNAAPCGDIYILPGNLTYRHDGSAVQEVLAKIVLHDGTVEVGRFPYPFIYRGEAQNPFVHPDKLSPNGGVPVQQPPSGSDVDSMPLAVQVVLKHTNPENGTTTMPECTSRDEAPAA